jgi:branched-chain amino acid transport system substrate-binding protein
MSSQSPKTNPPLPRIFYTAGLLLLLGVSCNALLPRQSFQASDDMGLGGDRGLNSQRLSKDSSGDRPTSRFSAGEFAFFPQDGTADKAAAIAAYGQKNYASAYQNFQRSLQQRRNDPESWIYANNIQAFESNPLKIAVSVPIGTDTNGAREILRGVAQAQQEINSSGDRRRLEVVIANDDNQAQVAQKVAQQLVDRPDILGVVGHFASDVTLATADIYTRGHLTMISPISSAVQISNKSPYLFRTVPSDYMAARALADYMLNQLQRKKVVVYFNSQSDYSKSLKGEFGTAIALQDGQVVGEYDLADSSFSAKRSLESAAQGGAEVILLASSTSTLDQALQVMQVNASRLPMLAGDDLYAPKILEMSQDRGKNLVLAVPWHAQAKQARDFAQRSRQFWGGEISWRTVTAYDATQALAAALAQSPSRTGVQQALRHQTFSAPGAVRCQSFLPSGDCSAPVQLVSIAPGNSSGFGYDFVPLP